MCVRQTATSIVSLIFNVGYKNYVFIYFIFNHNNYNEFKFTSFTFIMTSVHRITYLIQLSGSFLQSVLHLKRSHASQPIGGVRAKPFSKARHKEKNTEIRGIHLER